MGQVVSTARKVIGIGLITSAALAEGALILLVVLPSLGSLGGAGFIGAGPSIFFLAMSIAVFLLLSLVPLVVGALGRRLAFPPTRRSVPPAAKDADEPSPDDA